MKTITILSVLLISSILFIGCATIFKGSTEGINFTSQPQDADVIVNGVDLGKTPIEINLKTNKIYTIEFKKEGFGTKTVVLNNSVSGGYVVLDILGGLLPVVIDAATGGWYTLDQEHVNAILESQNK
jgi:hypothetical protein